MAYGEFYVERQGWVRWPKVLLMCRKHGDGIERRRYVPDAGTCEVECFDDGVDEGMDGEWYFETPTWYLSCGHDTYGSTRPCYCSTCGRKVVA